MTPFWPTTTVTTPAIAFEYIWFAGQPAAQVNVLTTATSWTFTDHLGTPLLQTDSTKAVIWRAEHEPYGRIYAMRAGAGSHQPLRFPGQEAEQVSSNPDNGQTERSYNIFRWYRGGWERYSQADPIGIGGGTLLQLNDLFAYASSNPIVNEDPTGLYTVADNCDDKMCGPPSPRMCSSTPRTTVCIDDAFRRVRERIRSNKKCASAIDSFLGGGNGATDVVRSTFRHTPGPRMTCHPGDCGGRPSFYPLGTIPVCGNLFDSNSLLHEVLHYFGVPDGTAREWVILKRCYPDAEPGGAGYPYGR